jgi:hypothetical protein
MSHKTAATVAHTIGIDTGKNTLHLIGLDDQGAVAIGSDPFYAARVRQFAVLAARHTVPMISTARDGFVRHPLPRQSAREAAGKR